MDSLNKLVIAICAQNKEKNSTRTQAQLPAFVSPTQSAPNPLYPLPITTSVPQPAPPGVSNTTQVTPPTPRKTLFPLNAEFENILSRPLIKDTIELMEDSFAKGTIGNYTSALNTFTKFCNDHDIAEDLRFPTDERVLCAFITSLNKTVSGSTAKTMITGLKRWHEIHHVDWKGSERTALLVRGVRNNAPPESKRPKRLAVTPRMLADLDAALDHTDPKDAAVLACAKAAFFGQARLGELLATSRLKHNPSSHPSRNSVVILLYNNAREIKLPKTKTNQADGESIHLTRQSDPLNPVKALENHFLVNHGLSDSDHLFAYRSSIPRSGRHSLTKEDFMKRVNDIWSALGYQRFTGHSFRIGGTTTLLRNGVPPDVVKELGRWSSDAFHEYWRDIPEIATRHVEFLHISGDTHYQHANNNIGQARRLCRPSSHHTGQTQLQGRPAYRPY